MNSSNHCPVLVQCLPVRGVAAILAALLFYVAPCHGQGALRITFDGSPQQPPGTSYYVEQYFESGMWFRPVGAVGPGNGFIRTGGGESGFPDNGTAYIQASADDSLVFSFTNDSVYDLVSVDLAEYSVSESEPTTVPFVGYRHDGTVVTTNFITDGSMDGTGPLRDFETFYFGPEFTSLDRVEIPADGWSLDNLVVHRFGVSAPTREAKFGALTNLPLGTPPVPPRAMITGDFDADGILDIALLADGISLFSGLGNGTFGQPTTYPLSTVEGALAAGHFKPDGNLDLVVVDGTNTYILLNDGAGHFTVTTLQGFADKPVAVAVGDFNGDGKEDLAIANTNDWNITVALGLGDGTFGFPLRYWLDNPPTDIRLGDLYRNLNRNGKVDLAVPLLSHGSINSNSFCVLRNRGDGTFYDPQYYAWTEKEDHYALELADFQGDGYLDVAVLNYYSGSVRILVNFVGSGFFVGANTISVGLHPTSIAAADFNGDGSADLLVRSDGTDAKLLLGRGDASVIVEPAIIIGSPAPGPANIALADYNADGKPDVAVLSENSVAIMLNQTLPSLQITRIGTYIEIAWPTILGAGFTIQYTTDLTDPASWQSLPFPPEPVGAWTRIVDPTEADVKFYRLKKP